MASSGSPDNGTASPGEPAGKDVPESGEADKGPAGQVDPLFVDPSGLIGPASALTLGLASQYTGLMMGMLQNFLHVAQGYNAALEGRLRERIKADIEALPKPKPAEPPPVKVVRFKVEPATVPVKGPAVARPGKAKTTGSGAKVKPASKAGKMGVKDDFKQISGIGPKLEIMLHDKGLYRFSDIASLTEDDARKLDAELGLGGRILKDGWIGAAKALQSPKRKLRGAS